MSVSINGTNGVTFNDGSVQTTSALTGWRNRIINGDMRIDQRNAGALVSGAGNGATQYLLDRWYFFENGSMVFSAQQSTNAPAGFSNSLLMTTTTAATAGSSDRCQLIQRIEGNNVVDLAWGSASARSVTLSFWVRSSLTGTFGGSLQNSAGDRSYPFTYSISSANTWEQKTVTISGDTSGTWLTNTGVGIALTFDLGMGSSLLGTSGSWASSDFRGATGGVKVSGTLNATWQITGVQLESGSTATEFERRPYGTELALCQRYYQTYVTGGTYKFAARAWVPTLNSIFSYFILPVVMRSSPTATKVGTWWVTSCDQPIIVDSLATQIIIFGQRNGAGTGDTFFYSPDGTGITLSSEL